MKQVAFSSILLATSAVGASEPMVPVEFRGTWVLSAADCSRKEGAKLVISDAGVESSGIHGFINAVTTSTLKSIEVIFKPIGGRATSRNVYAFALSPDGTKLYQLKGAEVSATRVKCEEIPK